MRVKLMLAIIQLVIVATISLCDVRGLDLCLSACCVWFTPDGTKNECYVSGYRCVFVSRSEWVYVSLDKTVNPQATRTQYPVCPFLISCLTLVEREAVGRGWRGTAGPVAPETGDTAGWFEKSLRWSPYLSVSGSTPNSDSFFPFSLSAFIISDLIKPRRAACSAMKHLLAVCYKIVVGEERWWGLISHYAKTVAIFPHLQLAYTNW